MFCGKCGTEMPDEAGFCPSCGNPVDNRSDKDAPVSPADETEDANEAEPSNAPSPSRGKKTRTPLMLAVACVAVVVVAVAVFLGTGGATPALSEDRIVDDVSAVDWASQFTTNSRWASNEGYNMISATVLSVEDIENSPSDRGAKPMKRARCEVVLENASFRVTISISNVYQISDGKEWQLVDSEQSSADVVPVGGVDDEALLSRVSYFMQMVDQEPMKDANGNKLLLSDIYGEGASFEVLENNTTATGGSARIGLTKESGLFKCEGVLTVELTYTDGDWTETGCSVDKGAYEKDYSAMIGEHASVFQRVEGINGSERHCYGGRANPLMLNIKSYDPIGSTITADITFTVHNHLDPSNIVEQSDGDSVYTATDVIIPLRFDDYYHEIYTRNDVNGAADIEVHLAFDKDSSVVKAHIEDSYWPGGDWDTFDDYYTIDLAA